ncbi:MAG: CAP domain-containing protein [Patescibacteria group bacterium]|nr:CAP domain-containing protein [Patescibacteria group bacterium]
MATKIKIKFNLYLTLIFTAILAVFIFAPKISLAATIDEGRLVQLANQERTAIGLNALAVNPLLYSAAKSKAEDMLADDYFEHFSPSGQSPWDFIHAAGYIYQMAGENLAIDFIKTDSVHSAWMNSPAHKANILKSQYQDIAIAAVDGEFAGHQTTVVVEMFGKPASKQFAIINELITKIQSLILGIENK